MYVWGAAQRGIPAQVNVIGTIMFVGSLAMVLIAQAVGRARQKR
jgi:spermidine/putrescine transport system permease protein